MCLAAAALDDGGVVLLAPCAATDRDQQWAAVAGAVVDTSEQRFGWVSAGGSTAVGAQVWLYDVVAKAAYCKAHRSCSFAFDPSAGVFKNPAGNCVVLKPAPSPSPPAPGPRPPPPPPPPPGPHPRPAKPGTLNYTCAAGSPEAGLPFCDTSLGFDARAEDLVNRLNTTEQVGFFFSYPGTPYIERFNLKTWSLDATCIHGVASRRAGHVTVFPHVREPRHHFGPLLTHLTALCHPARAVVCCTTRRPWALDADGCLRSDAVSNLGLQAIAQGATWDVDLVMKMSNVTVWIGLGLAF